MIDPRSERIAGLIEAALRATNPPSGLSPEGTDPKAAGQDALNRKVGDGIAEVDETRRAEERDRPLSDERKARSTQPALPVAVCDERENTGTTPASAAAGLGGVREAVRHLYTICR